MVLFGISKKDHEARVREAVEFEVARVSASYEEAIAKRNKRIEDLKDQNMEFYNKRREAMDERVSVIKKSLDNVEVNKAVIKELKEEKKQALLELAEQMNTIKTQARAIKMLQDTNSIIRDMITKDEMCIDEAGIGRQHGNL